MFYVTDNRRSPWGSFDSLPPYTKEALLPTVNSMNPLAAPPYTQSQNTIINSLPGKINHRFSQSQNIIINSLPGRINPRG